MESGESGELKVRIDAFHALVASAFCAGLSMPLTRVFLLLALVLTIREAVQGRVRWRISASAWGWIAYVVLAVTVTALVAATLPEGALIDPARGLRKTDKLLWYAGVLLFPLHVTTRDRFRQVLSAFTLGAGLYAVCILVFHPIAAGILSHYSNPMGRVWHPPKGSLSRSFLNLVKDLGMKGDLKRWCIECQARGSFNKALAYMSGMGAGQRMMAAALTSLWLLPVRWKETGRFTWVWKVLPVVLFAGLVVTLKRGSLFVFLLLGLVFAMRHIGGKRCVLALALLVVMVWTLPASRARLRQIPDEFRLEKGGRVLLWTNLAPAIRKQYPWGVGFRGLTYPALRYATDNGWRLEQKQNHLHNNILQVQVEFGNLGLAVYFAWMALAFRSALRRARTPWADETDGDGPCRTAPLVLLAAFFLNGLVEYNLADGEITLLYGLAMGLAETRPAIAKE